MTVRTEPREALAAKNRRDRTAAEREARRQKAQAVANAEKIRRRTDVLHLELRGEELFLRGRRPLVDGAGLLIYLWSAGPLALGLFSLFAAPEAAWWMLPLGAVVAGAIAIRGLRARVGFELHLQGEAACFTQEPQWFEADFRGRSFVCETRAIRLYLTGRDANPHVELLFGGEGNATIGGLSARDIGRVGVLERWLATRA